MNIPILCDTNIFIEVFRNNPDMEAALNNIGLDNILISDVIKAELLFGARDKRELEAIRKYLSNFSSLTIQPEISKMAVNFVESYCLSQKLNLPDALIAATAIYHSIELFTLNTKDFKFIPDIKLYQISM
ncbi:MAG: type II toxin-antitoxin system VapC family toxin [Candidatus Azobacteroides sp.]|nr:type II toxin-antitoxin system VapC family toxin [Candidatus Azobacteroides sp.]